MASGGAIISPPTPSSLLFARNLFRALNQPEEIKAKNIIVSPAAARSAMTLVFMAAGGKTADELRTGLLLGTDMKLEIAKQHAEFLRKECMCGDKGVSMRPATGLFVKDHLELVPDFNMQTMEYFNTQADTLNFTDAQNASRHVNNWIGRQTFHTIRDLFSPASFSQESSIILVNSLYFRGKWAKRFSIERTLLDDFWINDEQRMQVLMMRQVGQFRYGESRKLKSRILQLPFEESDITMLFIVPFDINGLAELEMKLQEFDLNEVAMKLIMHDVDIMVPKFRMECDIDLKMPLHKLGVTRVFKSGSADLSGLFAKKSSELITQARQKLYLNFNEVGCESDASAPFRPAKTSKNPERTIFKANHPFVFAIRNNRNAYFVGHFVKP